MKSEDYVGWESFLEGKVMGVTFDPIKGSEMIVKEKQSLFGKILGLGANIHTVRIPYFFSRIGGEPNQPGLNLIIGSEEIIGKNIEYFVRRGDYEVYQKLEDCTEYYLRIKTMFSERHYQRLEKIQLPLKYNQNKEEH